MYDTRVETRNLDAFKAELARIAPALITECSSRQMQHELACSISVNDDPNLVMLNSKEWWDFRPSRVDTTRIMSMMEIGDSNNQVKNIASLIFLMPGMEASYVQSIPQIAQK